MSHIRRRTSVSIPAGSRGLSSPNLGGSSPKLPPSPAPDAFSFLETRRKKQYLFRGLLAAVGLLVVLSFFWQSHSQQSVRQLALLRKDRLKGVGESFVLPKRYRDTALVSPEKLPICKRVLLFQFSECVERLPLPQLCDRCDVTDAFPTHSFLSCCGFAGELSHLLRATFIANKMGYTLLADDSESVSLPSLFEQASADRPLTPSRWNYASLREYFLPRQIHCQPPLDWFLLSASVPLGSKRWNLQDRVYYTRAQEKQADDWIREEMLDPSAMEALSQKKFASTLPEGSTLPEALEEVFSDFSSSLREIWRPNDLLATMIRTQRMELGLGEGGLRGKKNSPVWGGNRRPGDTGRRPAVEDVEDEEEHDFDEAGGAERSDRGPIIGVHVRLGMDDKSWRSDMTAIGLSNQDYRNLTVFIDGADDAVRRLSTSSVAEPSYARGRISLFPTTAKPKLVILSSEQSSAARLEAAMKVNTTYTIQPTSPPPTDSLRPWKDFLDIELAEKKDELGMALDITAAYEQTRFNALPRSLRTHLTRYFLRDLTTLSLHADAFVVSGSSNIGQLACLLAGLDAVVGPRDLTGAGLGGRVRSIDSYWYPTAKPKALFGP